MSTVSESLSQLEVLVVDCQATAAAPHGHLLEMGWARAGTTTTRADARLIALPDGEHIPAAVMRLTGISGRLTLAFWQRFSRDSQADNDSSRERPPRGSTRPLRHHPPL